jgi:hypothetical protein
MGGLETQMFTFLVLAGATAYLHEIQSDKAFPASALLFALAALTRPEGVLIFGVTCLHRCVHNLLVKRGTLTWKAVIWALAFLSVYCIYFVLRYSYYGFFFPNTFYAKSGGGVDQLLRGLTYLGDFVATAKWPVLVCLTVVPLLTARRSSVCYLLMLVVSFSSYVVYVGGDFLGMFRYFVPVIPQMAILVQEGAVGSARVVASLKLSPLIRRSAVAFLCIAFVLVCATGLRSSFTGPQLKRVRFHRRLVEKRTLLGTWLRQHVDAEDSVAALAIGAISYYSGLETIDRFGMTDIHIAHTQMPNMGKGLAGHEKRNLSYVLSKKPTFFFGSLVFPKNSRLFTPTMGEIAKFTQLYEPFVIDDLEVSLRRLKEEHR